VQELGEELWLFASDWPHGAPAWPESVEQVVKRPGAHGARQAEDPGGERDAPVPAPAGVAQERVLVRVTDGDVETKKTLRFDRDRRAPCRAP